MKAYAKDKKETTFFYGISNKTRSIYLVIPFAIRSAQLSELHSNYDYLVKVLANAFPLPPGSTPIVID